MGIQGLSKLLSDHAPNSVRQQQIKNYFGRKIAIDASMHIYQFLIVVGRAGESNLTNEAGDTTSHLQGMFFRTIRMLEEGEWGTAGERLRRGTMQRAASMPRCSSSRLQLMPRAF